MGLRRLHGAIAFFLGAALAFYFAFIIYPVLEGGEMRRM